MTWTFLQIGKLITPAGFPAVHQWYSGHEQYANCPADEGLKGLGPIPCGRYAMVELLTNTHMGPVAIRLRPDAETRARIIALGRDPDSFFIHDDTAKHDHEASEGCLVSVSGSQPVLDMWHSACHDLLVKAE